MTIYTVAPGDTLWELGSIYGVPISTLMRVNGLTTGMLVPGMNLYIPDQAQAEQFYQVKAGDTLWGISQQFRTTIQAIVTANPSVDLDTLRIGQRLRIPGEQKYEMESLAFVDAFASSTYLDILKAAAPAITYLAIFTYSFTHEGILIEVQDEEIIQASKAYAVQPLMVVSNYENRAFSAELADQVLSSSSLRQTLIQQIVAVVNRKGYAGVSLDFEFVLPARRNDFTAFLRELKFSLGQRILHVNVHAKTADLPTNRLTGFLDYRAIGQIADMVAVMTIEYGYAAGAPYPISPVWWIEQVLRYATGQINRRKVMMAVNLYGYDWTLPQQQGTIAEMISVNAAQNRAIANWSSIQYDWRSHAPGYRYVREEKEHAVWFEDIRSMEAKYELMEVYNLLGATYWRLGFEFPQNWAYVEKNMQVLKNLSI